MKNAQPAGLSRWSHSSAIIGGMVWLILLAIKRTGTGIQAIELLLLLAILVLSPIALALTAAPNRSGHHPLPYVVAVVLQPFAAAFALTSCFLRQGLLAGSLVLGWLVFTTLTASFGLARLLPRGFIRADESAIDMGLLYLPVGGLWLLIYRLGANPLGFVDTIVLLTAVHFHYAGFIVPVLVGLTGRELEAIQPSVWWAFRIVVVGTVLAPALIAVGITLSPLAEVIGALMLVASSTLLSVLTVFVIVPAVRHRLAQGLLCISAVSLFLAMIFAVGYAIGEFREILVVTMPRMVQVHGWLNALGTGLCGLLAWAILNPEPHVLPSGIPFSRLSSRGRVGSDFLERIHAVPTGLAPPLGLVDDLGEYGRADFCPEEIHPAIRAFYERTAEHSLVVRPQWKGIFTVGGRIYKSVSSRVQQINFPLFVESREALIHSRMVPVSDRMDGRTRVRAWIRTYASTGKAMYVAVYSTHRMGTQTYMNIAFPLPGGNLTSVLRLEAIGVEGQPKGILLTTRPSGRNVGDEGIYFANPLLPVRLPMNETIRVWPANTSNVSSHGPVSKGATVIARHDMWLCGFNFLSLEYEIIPKQSAV